MVNKRFSQKQMILLKLFLCTRRTPFWQPRWKNFDSGDKFSLNVRKSHWNTFKRRNDSQHSPMDTRNAFSTILPKNFCQKSDIFFPEFPKVVKRQISEANVPPKKILWTRRMHFWHPSWASLKKSRKFFAECPEMILKLPFLSTKTIHPNTFYWHVVCRVHNLARLLKKIWSSSEIDEKFIFHKNFYLKIFIWTLGMQFWQNFLLSSDKKSNLFRSFSKNDKKI